MRLVIANSYPTRAQGMFDNNFDNGENKLKKNPHHTIELEIE